MLTLKDELQLLNEEVILEWNNSSESPYPERDPWNHVKRVFVLGITNRAASIPSELTKPGLFELEVELGSV